MPKVRGGDYCIPTIAGTLNARAETPEMDEQRKRRWRPLLLHENGSFRRQLDETGSLGETAALAQRPTLGRRGESARARSPRRRSAGARRSGPGAC